MVDTVNNGIPFVPENTIDPAAGLNLSLNTIDALMQVLVQTVAANSPPGSPANGARYIVGTSPTGAWAGQANKLARYLDSAWQFFDARYVLNVADGAMYVRSGSTWAALSGGGGGEANTASNLGAGEGLYASKVGVDLQFKSLVAGTNVTLTSDGDSVTIDAAGGGGGSGTVTSVALSAPTGFDVSGSPVTASGTLALSFSTGYSLPTNTNQANWTTAFGWGDHATAGYEKELTAGANITIDRTDPDNPVISASASSGMTNPMTTAGDVIKGGTGGTPERLAIGTTGQVLTVVGGTPVWDDLPAAGTGDVVGPASAANNGVALFDGTSGKLLKDGGVLGSAAFTASDAYATAAQGTLAGTALQPAAVGSTIQGWSANLDSWSAIAPSAKQDTLVSATNIKTINGASVLGSGDLTVGDMTNPMTAAGDIIVGGASGVPTRLAKGTDGQLLLMAAGVQAYGNNPILAGYKETLETMATNAIDVSTSNVKKRVLTAASTFTITGATSGFSHALTLLVEGGNTHAVTWPASFKWLIPIPVLTAKHLISGFTIDGGTTWLVNYEASYV